MNRKITLLALGAAVLLPLAPLTSASASDYYGSRLENHIDRDRDAIHHDYQERNYYAHREHEAARNGNWLGASWFSWRKHHEEREIASRQNDLHRDYERLEHYR